MVELGTPVNRGIEIIGCQQSNINGSQISWSLAQWLIESVDFSSSGSPGDLEVNASPEHAAQPSWDTEVATRGAGTSGNTDVDFGVDFCVDF